MGSLEQVRFNRWSSSAAATGHHVWAQPGWSLEWQIPGNLGLYLCPSWIIQDPWLWTIPFLNKKRQGTHPAVLCVMGREKRVLH